MTDRTTHPSRSPIPTSAHNSKQPLSELKIIVHPEIPQDELWVHPAMFDLLQRASLEIDSKRGVVCYGY